MTLRSQLVIVHSFAAAASTPNRQEDRPRVCPIDGGVRQFPEDLREGERSGDAEGLRRVLRVQSELVEVARNWPGFDQPTSRAVCLAPLKVGALRPVAGLKRSIDALACVATSLYDSSDGVLLLERQPPTAMSALEH